MPGKLALAPNIVAMLGKVDLDVIMLERGADCMEAYRAYNLKAQVPALRFDDRGILTEAIAIMRYLPATASYLIVRACSDREWARIDEALSDFSTVVHSDFGGFFAPICFAWSDEAREPVTQATNAKLRLHSERLSAQIETADRQFYSGSRTIADANRYVLPRWFDSTLVALSDYLALLRYRDKMSA